MRSLESLPLDWGWDHGLGNLHGQEYRDLARLCATRTSVLEPPKSGISMGLHCWVGLVFEVLDSGRLS